MQKGVIDELIGRRREHLKSLALSKDLLFRKLFFIDFLTLCLCSYSIRTNRLFTLDGSFGLFGGFFGFLDDLFEVFSRIGSGFSIFIDDHSCS